MSRSSGSGYASDSSTSSKGSVDSVHLETKVKTESNFSLEVSSRMSFDVSTSHTQTSSSSLKRGTSSTEAPHVVVKREAGCEFSPAPAAKRCKVSPNPLKRDRPLPSGIRIVRNGVPTGLAASSTDLATPVVRTIAEKPPLVAATVLGAVNSQSCRPRPSRATHVTPMRRCTVDMPSGRLFMPGLTGVIGTGTSIVSPTSIHCGPFDGMPLVRLLETGCQTPPLQGVEKSTQTGLLTPPTRSVQPQFEPRSDLVLDTSSLASFGDNLHLLSMGHEELAALVREEVQRSFLERALWPPLARQDSAIQAPRLLELLRWAWSDQMLSLAAFDYCSDAMRRQQEHRVILVLSFLMRCERAVLLHQ